MAKGWDAYLAQNRPQNPVGALDELEKHNLPARIFPSCAEPSFDGSIRGCDKFDECDRWYKGLPSTEGGGPRAHCWQHLKNPANGGGVVRSCMPCFWGIEKMKLARDNDEVIESIADEGEEYEALTWVPNTSGPRDNAGYQEWNKKLVKKTVPAFKRLGEEEKLAEHELRASIVAQNRKRLEDERKAKFLGIKKPSEGKPRGDSRKGEVGPKEG